MRKKLSLEELKTIKQNIKNLLAIDRHSLVISYPFIATIIMRMNIIPVRDKRCRTACTDGKNIFFDCDFYTKLSKHERRFVLAHEVWHCVMFHLVRLQTRNRTIFNIATDMEVNNIIQKNVNVFKPPKNVLFPPENLKDKSAEEIYEYLIKQQKTHKSFSNFEKNNCNKCDNDDEFNSKELSGQFDKHTYANTDNDINDSKDKFTIEDQWGEVEYDDDFKINISKNFSNEMREAIVSAIQHTQKTHGSIPSEISYILEKIIKPEIPWNEYLNQFVSACYTGKRNWLPPNRRHVYNDMYFQSRHGECIKGIVAIDTSGSCVRFLPKFFGELKSIIDTFGNYELTVICADAAVDQVDIYDNFNNPLDFNDNNIQWSGGGGTDYGPVFQYIEDNGLLPDFVIYIGDGFAEMSYTKKPTYPVLWLITKDGTFDFCDWGKKIQFTSYE